MRPKLRGMMRMGRKRGLRIDMGLYDDCELMKFQIFFFRIHM